ncbi:putative Ecp2 effector protein domain-containing protein [Seiridium cardinale]
MLFPSIPSVLAVVSTASVILAAPLEQLETRASVVLPASTEAYLCNTQSNSPGTSNIRVGIAKMQASSSQCAPGKGGAEVRMFAGDGYSFYIGSTGGIQTGNFPCSQLADQFIDLANVCGQLLNNDDRAGGVFWVPGYEGHTYVFATAATK